MLRRKKREGRGRRKGVKGKGIEGYQRKRRNTVINKRNPSRRERGEERKERRKG